MPWKDKTVEGKRSEFVSRVLSGEKSKSALCREYGISRPTGDKWIKRHMNGEGLSDRSRRPFHTANRISQELEDTIVAARRKEPAIGARKTKRMLENNGLTMPAMSTIIAIPLLKWNCRRWQLPCKWLTLANAVMQQFLFITGTAVMKCFEGTA